MSVPSSAAAAVVVDGLVKRYAARTVVDGLTFTAAAGEVTAVLGPNGAGKTTTIECCEGLRRPDSGAVRVLGVDALARSAHERARVGVMLQTGGVGSGVRAAEALTHQAALYADPLAPADLLERLGLTHLGRTPWRRMSGGEQRRLAFALAVVGRPELVFLDEPTAGLDPAVRRVVWDTVRQLRSAGVTVVLSTHHLDEAEQLADRVVIVAAGRVVASGSPQELTHDPAGEGLSFEGPAHLDVAGLAGALPAGHPVTEGPAGVYRVGGEVDPQILAAVTAWCAQHGVLPRELRTGRRTLEDVFLDLTGERADVP